MYILLLVQSLRFVGIHIAFQKALQEKVSSSQKGLYWWPVDIPFIRYQIRWTFAVRISSLTLLCESPLSLEQLNDCTQCTLQQFPYILWAYSDTWRWICIGITFQKVFTARKSVKVIQCFHSPHIDSAPCKILGNNVI